ncbi:MAG: protein arginine N-methyltransferase 1 [Myxococcota bacterium]|jgi:protein arginine N-methyltransferase 1
MVSDRARTVAFADALKEVVNDGDHVIDFGTGTGLLAMLSALAGADRVYGLDRTIIAEYASRLVEENDLADLVSIIRVDAKDFTPDQPVDLIVSEWLGHFAYTENMLPAVLACRDKDLREGGVMMPSAVDLLLAPVETPGLYADGPGFWDINIRGIDFSSLETAEVMQAIAVKTVIRPEEVIARPRSLVRVDLAKVAPEDVWQSGTLEFVIQRDAIFYGFAGWFDAQLSPSVNLGTGPWAPTTHWQQTYFPLEPRKVFEGERLPVEYTLSEHPGQSTSVALRLIVDGERYNFMVN